MMALAGASAEAMQYEEVRNRMCLSRHCLLAYFTCPGDLMSPKAPKLHRSCWLANMSVSWPYGIMSCVSSGCGTKYMEHPTLMLSRCRDFVQIVGQTADLVDLQRILQRSKKRLNDSQQQNMTVRSFAAVSTLSLQAPC